MPFIEPDPTHDSSEAVADEWEGWLDQLVDGGWAREGRARGLGRAQPRGEAARAQVTLWEGGTPLCAAR